MYERKFTLRHAIWDFSELEEQESEPQDHFGVPWKIVAKNLGTSLDVMLVCPFEDSTKPWSISTNYEFRAVSITGKGEPSLTGSNTFIRTEPASPLQEFRSWDYMIQNHVVDDTVIIECDVTIVAMKGFVSFQERESHLTDIAMRSGKKKINVSRVLLATFSSYFDSFFFAKGSGKKNEVKGVDGESFATFLAFLHGQSFVTDDNVESLLKSAYDFKAPTVRSECEQFLIHSESIDKMKKLQFADSYGLTSLQESCLSNVKSVKDITDLLPENFDGFKKTTLVSLLQMVATTSQNDEKSEKTDKSKAEKSFTLRFVINDFPNLKSECSSPEMHLDVPWYIAAKKHNEKSLSLFVTCENNDGEKGKWSIEGVFEMRVLSTTGGKNITRNGSCVWTESGTGWGFSPFTAWDDIIKAYMADDTVTVECDVTLKKMNGVPRKKKIDFNDRKRHLTDAVLKVGKKTFNVSKVVLATYSPYFDSLFFERPNAWSRLEVALKNCDDYVTFQSFLEVIHGEISITSDNVEQLLKMADQFKVERVRSKCEAFLLKCNDIEAKDKFRMADVHKLTALKNHCLKDVTNDEEIRRLLPANVKKFSQETLAILLQKTISRL